MADACLITHGDKSKIGVDTSKTMYENVQHGLTVMSLTVSRRNAD